MLRPLLLASAALALAGCGDPPVPDRPNVLVISVDTLRADALGCYGAEHPTSPNIDALAADGVLCVNAVSTTSWTLPAHVSMLTGLDISAHGMCDERVLSASHKQGVRPPLKGDFVSQSFQRAGYRTAGLYTWKYLEPRFGFGLGFDDWRRVGSTIFSNDELRERYERLRDAGDEEAVRRWAEESPQDFDLQAPTNQVVVDEALAWLDEGGHGAEGGEPFFLFLHLFDVHDEYVAPPPFDTRFDTDYDGPVDGRKVTSPDSLVDEHMPARDLDNLRSRYLGEVAWTDHQLGRLFDELERRGLTEDTLIVLTSDHGEEFFEHGKKAHRTQLYRESVQVPLIFSWPGGLPSGLRVDGVTGIVDLAPTLAALADIPGPEAVCGTDLSAVLRGEAPNEERAYLSELLVFRGKSNSPEHHLSIHLGDEHLVRRRSSKGTFELHRYDRAADPLELGPGERHGPGTPAFQRFTELLAPLRDRAQAARDASPWPGTRLGGIDEDTADELAAMGYLGDTSDTGTLRSTERLCLDGCLGVPTTAPPTPDSQ